MWISTRCQGNKCIVPFCSQISPKVFVWRTAQKINWHFSFVLNSAFFPLSRAKSIHSYIIFPPLHFKRASWWLHFLLRGWVGMATVMTSLGEGDFFLLAIKSHLEKWSCPKYAILKYMLDQAALRANDITFQRVRWIMWNKPFATWCLHAKGV